MDVKSMTTAELKAIVQKDCNSEKSELSDDDLFAVLAELALREGKSSETEANDAWQRFLRYWVPGVRDIPGDNTPPQQSKPFPRFEEEK